MNATATQYTPGPWAWDDDNGWLCAPDPIAPDDDDMGMIVLELARGGDDVPVERADRALIAAAPELLEALQDAVDKSEVLGERFDFARWREEVARPAIARARA